MPPYHPPIPRAASPIRQTFDPWNSSSTGHQRAENRLSGSTSWRSSRTMKLGHQFRSPETGGERIFDTVGAGSLDFGKDGRKENGSWERGAPGLREKGWRDVSAMMMGGSQAEKEQRLAEKRKRALEHPETKLTLLTTQEDEKASERKEKHIFAGLTIYINGSTAPAISDHKLKQLLASHGANISIALGRRSVTHVILGQPNDARGAGLGGGLAAKKGAGGGLAGSKIQKEISRVGWKGIKYVSVEWVIESLKAGKRVPEARFETLRTAPKGVGSVYDMFKQQKSEGGVKKEEEEGKRAEVLS